MRAAAGGCPAVSPPAAGSLPTRLLPPSLPPSPSLPSKQAADIVRILGIGRNEYIAVMVQVRASAAAVAQRGAQVMHFGDGSGAAFSAGLGAGNQPLRMPPQSCLTQRCLLHSRQAKSKKLMWRMNRGIVRDLLPQVPLPIAIGGCFGRVGGACGVRGVPLGRLVACLLPLPAPACSQTPCTHAPCPHLQTPGGSCTW